MSVTPAPTRYVSVPKLLKAWLTGVLGYENVATGRIPTNLTFLMPLVVVTRVGGGDDVITLDAANVDIDVFAADEDGAEAQAEHIRRELRLHLPRYQYNGTVVTKTETISGPRLLPFDSRNVVWRVGASYRISTHQYAGL